LIEIIHFLLTYQCNYECDHCFVFGSSEAKGTFTLNQLKSVFAEIAKSHSVKSVYFEGGEPFLFYPLLLEGVRNAYQLGLSVGIVTNGYWATTKEDAEFWLKPFMGLGINDLSVSSDSLHSDEYDAKREDCAILAARNLGIPTGTICIEGPEVVNSNNYVNKKGEPIVGGGVRFRGRAVDKLVKGLPLNEAKIYTSCPYEELMNPKRAHVDAFGNVSICQGITIGNMWQEPLKKIIENYDWKSHPICRPLVEGGPTLLASEYNAKNKKGYVDACHLCFETRKTLINKFPKQLAPKQVYGLRT